MGIWLEEFNLVRTAIDFDPETTSWTEIPKDQLYPGIFSWDNPNRPFKGCFADIGGERVFTYVERRPPLNIFGTDHHQIFHTSDGHKIQIDEKFRTEFEPLIDLPHANDERWMEFRLIDDATGQLRYKAIYDVMPILKMYWQDFTPYIEYKDWDFYAYLKDLIDQDREAAARVAQGLPPDPYSDPKYETPAKPALPFNERLRALPGETVPVSGHWWSPAFNGAERVRYFKQGQCFPDTKMTKNYGAVIWYYEPDRQPPAA